MLGGLKMDFSLGSAFTVDFIKLYQKYQNLFKNSCSHSVLVIPAFELNEVL